ncbi:MAG: cytochrome c [Chloroflexota bacterium]
MTTQYMQTPVEAEVQRRQLRNWIIAILLLALLCFFAWNRYGANRPVRYTTDEDHFKYGSIGSDIENGIPIPILEVLPTMFPEYLPNYTGPENISTQTKDYTVFGFIQEPGHKLPIGFSTRQYRGLQVTGLNCASCHTGAMRSSVDDEPQVILGMPANTVDLGAFFFFLFDSVEDYRFTGPEVVKAIEEKNGRMFFVDRLLYRFIVVSEMQRELLKRKAQLEAFMLPEHPKFGAGRVDTFNPYKTNQYAEYYQVNHLAFQDSERIGTADFPSIWNQKPRVGMAVHWDGDNASLVARNFSASFGAGATPKNVDRAAVERIGTWLQNKLHAPEYPYEISQEQAMLAQGEELYQVYCYDCHDFGGANIGKVDPISSIATSRNRLDSYTEDLVGAQHWYGEENKKYGDFEFDCFKKTDGYVNAPLDGIWARAPYLHNGSVPTVWDLLTPAEERSQDSFYRGHGVYDQEKMGIRTDVAEVDGRGSFILDVSLPGNSNQGHSGEVYGTELSNEDKYALIEYLKTYYPQKGTPHKAAEEGICPE